MKLRTAITIPSQEPKIDYNSKILLLGSCFAENIGKKFEYFKFRTLINPFGILFHPKAIETFLWMVTQKEKYVDSDLFFYNEQWHCFDAHSKLSNPDQSAMLSNLNNALDKTGQILKTATHINITLGTAWVYRLQSLDMIVANCHKIPQKEFKKELLSIEEIKLCIHNSIELIHSINPNAEIIFTISPVRHIKDGFIENNRSKSHLIAAIHQIVESVTKISYYPSYEIMMDELRDYRFYESDMLHPSKLAVDYIWDRFIESNISKNVLQTMQKVSYVQKGMTHRPFHAEGKKHQSFLQDIELKKRELQQEFPFLQF